MSFLFDRSIQFSDPATLDAFGRMRISNPFAVFSSHHQFSLNTEQWNQKTSGGGTATHLPDESAVAMTVGTASGDFAYRQTRQYVRYQPGRSQLIFLTGVLGAPKTNVTRRIGYFDANNGIFFRLQDSTFSVVIRSKTSGAVLETAIDQANWNIDPMDGNGPSGITIDPSKAQIFVIDFEWLGVGTVRCGFVIDGKFRYCHQFNHANDVTAVYMATANLPCRYDIENTGVTESGTTLKQICCAVFSEGGFNEPGYLRANGLHSSWKDVTTSSYLPIVSFRLKTAYARSYFVPLAYDLMNLSNSYGHFRVIRNPILTAASFGDISEAVQMDTSASAMTFNNDDVLCHGYYTNKVGITPSSFADSNITVLSSDFDGTTTDIITIAAKAISQNSQVLASMTWREHR